MKKLSFLLALVMIVSAMLASCSNNDDSTTAETTTKATTTRRNAETQDPSTITEPESPDLIDGSQFTVDGDLSDWEAANLHTVTVQGVKLDEQNNYENKKAVFYGALTDKGLFLACDAYHDIYLYEDVTWYQNSNFEFFIGTGNKQYYVFARGIDQPASTSATEVVATMKTVKIDQGTVYRTITEVFIATEDLNEADIIYNTIDVGVAWKTIGDKIIGGAATAGPNGEDEYWVPVWPQNSDKPVVAPSGIFMADEYEY